MEALLARGWRPVPFHDFILKIHARCDLACDYCYMYQSADQGWRERPKVMSPALAERAAGRIGEHLRAHSLTRVNVTLHGGEPLLAGPELITRVVRAVRREAGDAEARIQIQTNGVRLTESYLRLFDRLGVRVGVSLDGDRAAHDAHRRDARGRGSYDATSRALRRLAGESFAHLYAGLLCVVDPSHDPIATYRALLAFDPPSVDFLLPHGNWSAPPPLTGEGSPRRPYGEWLIAVFDHWYDAPRKPTRVRLFEEIINGLLGGTPHAESLGLEPDRIVVVETDGAIERSDALKSAYEGAAATGLNVMDASFDDALRLPVVAGGQLGFEGLSETCRACAIARVCGGGMYAHRYRPGSGFANPSVYCQDLYLLIGHIRRRLDRDVVALRAGLR
ncbi:FxsB family cyclophane-forming radical SAM/SPASM peptide maturase [Nonomuraea antri]|uniref:FxsB family cyclophane-forming radical SAM/SPASM peptide maturase n=1 Tax=Nonomuraea antri TaxID=2730852 RepID=UPI001F46D6E8|nr:FxsB family cyclophane-forming radical SAM/SPASM peptide maturase [Nonomuraea antri]